MTSKQIAALQQDLADLGYPIAVDGIFGPRTKAAVIKFQSEHGLDPDGIVGPKTALKLGAALALSDALPDVRVWPLRALEDGREPRITSRFSARNKSRPNHRGVDLFYAYKAGDPPKKVGDSGRTATWWIPENTWCVAASDGIVVAAGWSATGYRVWVEHQRHWKTGYFHMDRLEVTVGQGVHAGDRIGRVNDNPRDTDPDHLHFELFHGALDTYRERESTDPEIFLAGAKILDAIR
jgi:murein DD-endopeptidase MepM/ murein hydrolase activator NlpD